MRAEAIERVIAAPNRSTPRIAALACVGLFGGVAGLNIYGAMAGESLSGPGFHLIMAGLSFYLLLECLRHIRSTDALGLLAPPFLTSILHFLLAYALPAGGTLFDPWILDRFGSFYVNQSEQLSEAGLAIGLAAFCMWRGYGLALKPARKLRARLQRGRLLRRGSEPNLLAVVGLQAVYFSLVVYAISIGVFGMTGSAALREQHIALLDLLNLGVAAGSLSLFLLLTYLFRRRAAGHREVVLSVVCGLVVFLHLTVGALSGFKSQIVMPFVMLAFSRFVATRQISITFIAAACAALFFAYQIIEPFRAYIGQNDFRGAADIGKVLDALQQSQQQKDLMHETDLSWGTQVISRFDLAGMTSVGIAFAKDNPLVDEKSAEFAESLYLSPLLAFVPRALWPDKPSYSTGVWFSNVVLGKIEDQTTSVGMGPVTWLYMLGGLLGVGLGFFAIGIVQALLFEGVARAGAGGFIVFLSAVNALVMIPTDVGPAFTGMLRLLPIAVVAQLVLLRPDRRLSH
jgi:hypothetical protein